MYFSIVMLIGGFTINSVERDSFKPLLNTQYFVGLRTIHIRD